MRGGWRDAGRLREIEMEVRGIGDPWAEWEVARAWGTLGRWGPARWVLRRYPVLSTNEGYPRVLELVEAGRYAEAVRGLESIAELTRRESFVRMEIAELAAAHGDPDRTIAELEALFEWKPEPGEVVGFRNFYHPRGLYLLGRAYEAKGEARRAARAYEELLALWKDADPDLVDLRDARERLARLRRSGALR